MPTSWKDYIPAPEELVFTRHVLQHAQGGRRVRKSELNRLAEQLNAGHWMSWGAGASKNIYKVTVHSGRRLYILVVEALKLKTPEGGIHRKWRVITLYPFTKGSPRL